MSDRVALMSFMFTFPWLLSIETWALFRARRIAETEGRSCEGPKEGPTQIALPPWELDVGRMNGKACSECQEIEGNTLNSSPLEL